MKIGDRVRVVDDAEYLGMVGVFVDLLKDGRMVVLIDGSQWRVPFHPQAVELAEEE